MQSLYQLALTWVQYVNDVLTPISTIVGVAGGIAAVWAALNSSRARREVRSLQEAGIHFDNVKLQVHVLLEGVRDSGTVVGIRDIAQTTIADVIIGDQLANKVAKSAMQYKSTSSIFRMPTIAEQEMLFRDFVGWAGRNLPPDAVSHVLVILREPADNVGRSMLRACLFTLQQLIDFKLYDGTFVTEIGKAHHRTRINACIEVANLLAHADFDSENGFCDKDGYLIAHIVHPGSAAILRL